MRIGLDIQTKPGVYCIECIVDKKLYFGSSGNVRSRLHGHRSELINNNHDNEHLQNAFNKHGYDNFTMFVMEYCENAETALFREQVCLDLFLYASEYLDSNGADDRFKELGFNINPKADRISYILTEQQKIDSRIRFAKQKQDEEFLKKWRLSRKTDEFRDRMKEVSKNVNSKRKKILLAYNRITGEFIGEYGGIKECARNFGISYSCMFKHVTGKRYRYIADKVFKYKTSDTYLLQIDPIPQYEDADGRIKALDRIHAGNKRPILKLDISGNILAKYDSAIDVPEVVDGHWSAGNINRSIRRPCNAYGFSWKYESDTLSLLVN